MLEGVDVTLLLRFYLCVPLGYFSRGESVSALVPVVLCHQEEILRPLDPWHYPCCSTRSQGRFRLRHEVWPPEGLLHALWAFGSPYHLTRKDGGAWAWLDSSFSKGKRMVGLGFVSSFGKGKIFVSP
ncbi:unnamed protein product [Prunus armeniaca]|uniref:Uncharacterized protein n=1 Tax=Prunus armeniaca TaxID=36596 RepID=A0A6J5V438_PRUAR|nr:unnamed protein product [Prunus armeniaca]CAB4314085.1 unnamed protein product [Prunus armeniaca]